VSEYIVTTEDLTKKFKDKTAVDHVNLHIKRGAIYGLIGRNGAGKTTFMRMLTGMITPTSGKVVFESGETADYSRIGALIETPALNPKQSALTNIRTKCLAYGIRDKEYALKKLETVGLRLVAKKRVDKYSLGMRQRLGIAMALVGDPELLILDEPINGLDPQGIAEMRKLFEYLSKEKGTTIVISSHILEELSRFATDYAIIDGGKILEESTLDELRKKCSESIIIKTSETDKALEVLRECGYTKFSSVGAKTISLAEDTDNVAEVNMRLASAGVPVESITVAGADLEEYFINLTGSSSGI